MRTGNSHLPHYISFIRAGRACLTLFICSLLLIPPSVAAAAIEQQRELYQQARKALNAGQRDRFAELGERLKDYPLYVYLRYDELRPRLVRAADSEIQAFLEQYPDFPHSDSIRQAWLQRLAYQGRWEQFLDHFENQQSAKLRCLKLQGRIKTGRMDGFNEDAKRLWLTGKSQVDECDPVFAYMRNSGLLTSELIMERLQLALESNEVGLANYLARQLDGEAHDWAQRWINTHRNPDTVIANPGMADTLEARAILTYGMRRLVRLNLDRALQRWPELQMQYTFAPYQRDQVNYEFGLQAARTPQHRLVGELLAGVPASEVNGEIFMRRLRYALNNERWSLLRAWTSGEPPDTVEKNQWYFWHARALEMLGEPESARAIYRELAAERDYYGFLAADRIGASYQMNNRPPRITAEQRRQVNLMPAVQRAFEFRALGDQISARREWHHSLQHMTSLQIQVAAQLAAEQGWHDRAILALGTAKAYDNLDLRFPVLHRDALEQQARARDLDLAWVYGLLRAESAFWEDARSPAGALGLMQVMPKTGQMTARKLGMNNFQTSHLLQAEHNIPIGSHYLKMMYDDFNGNPILATAAYNAGPGRVRSWLPGNGCIDPEIWIENIPFLETRTYVKRVLMYAAIYDWRLEQPPVKVSERMRVVVPRKAEPMIASRRQCA